MEFIEFVSQLDISEADKKELLDYYSGLNEALDGYKLRAEKISKQERFYRSKVADLEAEIKVLRDDCIKFQGKIHNIEADKADLKNELSELFATNVYLTDENITLSSENDNVKVKLNEFENRFDSLNAFTEQTVKRNFELIKQSRDLKKKYDEISNENFSLHKKIDDYKLNINSAYGSQKGNDSDRYYKDYIAKCDELSEAKARNKELIERLKNEAINHYNEYLKLELEKEAVENELEQLKGDN